MRASSCGSNNIVGDLCARSRTELSSFTAEGVAHINGSERPQSIFFAMGGQLQSRVQETQRNTMHPHHSGDLSRR